MPLGAGALKESLLQLPLGQGAQPGSQSVRSCQLPLQRQQRPTPYRIAATAACCRRLLYPTALGKGEMSPVPLRPHGQHERETTALLSWEARRSPLKGEEATVKAPVGGQGRRPKCDDRRQGNRKAAPRGWGPAGSPAKPAGRRAGLTCQQRLALARSRSRRRRSRSGRSRRAPPAKVPGHQVASVRHAGHQQPEEQHCCPAPPGRTVQGPAGCRGRRSAHRSRRALARRQLPGAPPRRKRSPAGS